MKKLVFAVIALSLIFLFACCGNSENISQSEEETQISEEESATICGGWTEQNSEITSDTEEIFYKATANLVGVSYTPVKLLSTQVVAGTNYKFLCKVSSVDSASEEMKIVTVYEDLSGNTTVTGVENYK